MALGRIVRFSYKWLSAAKVTEGCCSCFEADQKRTVKSNHFN